MLHAGRQKRLFAQGKINRKVTALPLSFACCLLVQGDRWEGFVDFFEDAGIGEFEDGEDFGVLPDEAAFAVDEEVRAAHAEEAAGAVEAGDGEVEVAEEAEGDAALCGESAVFFYGVAADAEDGDFAGAEFGVVVAEGADFGGADGGEVGGVEENEDGGAVAVLRKAHVLPVVCGELKVRHFLIEREDVCHGFT